VAIGGGTLLTQTIYETQNGTITGWKRGRELLAILDQVITYDIPLLILNDHEIDPELVPAFRTWAENQAEKIKDGLSFKMISECDERAFEKSIQGYQRDIFRLAGLLLNYVEPEDLNAKLPTESVASLVQSIFITLQDVLNFIERRFSKYFDQDSWIPSDFKRIVKPEIARNIDALRADLLAAGCIAILVDIAMSPIYRFVSEASNNETNYRTILYVKELKANLISILGGNGDPNARLIKDTFYYLNFNCLEFVRYQTKTVGLLHDTCTDQEIVRELNRFRKELNQAQTKPSFALHPNQSSLRAQLSFLNMPVSLSTGLFEGNIILRNTSTRPAITCDPNGCNGAGTIRCSIFNASNYTYAITPLFVGFTLAINFLSSGKGLFSAPAGASSAANKGTLTINQPADADSFLFDGDFDISVVGGIIETMNGSVISLKGNIRDCEFRARPQTFIAAYLTARNIKILNDQVYTLQLDGMYHTCEYIRTSTSLTILNGTFFNFKPQSSVSILRINGYVLLAPEVSLQINGGETLEVNGKLVGNADTVIFIGQTSNVTVTGQVVNHKDAGVVIKSGNAGYDLNVHLKNAVLQAGQSAVCSMFIQSNDSLKLKIYGQSVANKPIQGNITFVVGSASDLTIDIDVEVIS